MKRDNFDELLRDKLDRIEVRPLADIWARIERQLPEIRDTAFEGETAPGAGGVLPLPDIRRPLHRKMSWAYVAASVGAVAALLFTMQNLPDENMMAGGDTIPVQIPLTESDTVDGGNLQRQSVPVTSVTSTESRLAARVMGAGDRGTAYTSGSVEEPAPTDMENLPVHIVQEDTGTAQTDSDNLPSSADRHQTGDSSDDSSGKKTWDGKSMTLEEWQRSWERRTSGISTSLFAMNFTGTSNPNGTIRSRTKLQNSNLWVIESDNYPDEDQEEDMPVTRATATESIASKREYKHSLPITFGASVNIGLTDRLSIETGVTYSYLYSKMEQSAGTAARTVTKQKLHYMGIPVKIKYDFLQTRIVNIYGSAGGAVEKLVSGKRTTMDHYENDNILSESPISRNIKVGSLQTSIGANAGAEFYLDRRFGIYIEPGIGYFFENGNQPESYRTENPLNFTIKAGIRVKL